MKYLVATKTGGVMEQPHFLYENPQWVKANSPEEAENIYNKRNRCHYYYGKCIGSEKTGQTVHNEMPKTNSFI